MSATSLEPVENNGLRLPIDGLIRFAASKLAAILRLGTEKGWERFLKFACVGFLGAIIDLGVSTLLLQTVFDSRDMLQLIAAATVSFVAAVLSNFFWNRYWTYPDSRSRSLSQQLALFGLVSLSGWIGRTIWLTLTKGFFSDMALNLVHVVHFPIDDKLASDIGSLIAILLGIFVVMIWNFFVNRHITYSDVRSSKNA
jgi:putative flippase GtrA